MKSISRLQISSALAATMVQEAIAYARAQNWEVCAAICDPAGHLAALARTDGVPTPAIQFAIDKAYTAATLGKSTSAFFERASSRPALAMGLANRERILVFPGGLVIADSGTILGGIGVSGAQDHEDVACASAILASHDFDAN